MTRRIRIAHSPDSDDAFMFAGLKLGKVETGPYEVVHELKDIEALNQMAREGVYELTALSFHAWPFLADRYQLLDVGASFGDGYGPLLVSRHEVAESELKQLDVAVPGPWTTAHLALRLALPEARVSFLPFDRIQDAVASGEVEAGLLIHEGQLTYGDQGLKALLDLGQWWKQETGLPLPLGGNAIRRDLGPDTIRDVTRMLAASIRWGLEHRDEALEHCAQYGRGLSRERLDRFVQMYVNDWTAGLGERGREAVELLLERGATAGLVPAVRVDWGRAD